MTLEERLHALIESAPAHIQRHFACDCAERALKNADVDDKRSWKAIEISRRFAERKATSDELEATSDELEAARDAAWAAAWAARDIAWAAWAAAWAARDIARDAAWAARDAAWAAARYAARYAARDAVRFSTDVEREWQIAHLQSMISNHNEARSSLLSVLQQRAESIQKPCRETRKP